MRASLGPAVVGALLAAAAPAAPPVEHAPSSSPERTWRATCGYCHGGPMKAPELRGLNLPEETVIGTVRAGAAGMPPFHQSAIGDGELRALARWIAAQPAPKP